MSIGLNIKRLRIEKGITQEQLAEYLGITSRAISQWECSRTSPDITQIPAICHVFGVSSDVLLGIDIEKNEDEIKKYLNKANDLGNSGKGEERTVLLREANGRFPRNYQIMLKLAESLVCEYSRKGIKEYGEVIELCNRILAECTDSNMRYEAIDTLAVAYDYAGKRDEMLRLANEMPKSHFSYENFMLYRWRGKRGFEERLNYISYLINQLISVIGCAPIYCKDDGKPLYSTEEQIELRKLQVDLLENLFPNKDYQYMAQEGEMACTYIASRLVRNNDIENALTWFEKAVDFAIHMDTYDSNEAHTSVVLRGYCDGGWIPEKYGGRSHALLERLLNDENLNALRMTPKYKTLVEKLEFLVKR